MTLRRPYVRVSPPVHLTAIVYTRSIKTRFTTSSLIENHADPIYQSRISSPTPLPFLRLSNPSSYTTLFSHASGSRSTGVPLLPLSSPTRSWLCRGTSSLFGGRGRRREVVTRRRLYACPLQSTRHIHTHRYTYKGSGREPHINYGHT